MPVYKFNHKKYMIGKTNKNDDFSLTSIFDISLSNILDTFFWYKIMITHLKLLVIQLCSVLYLFILFIQVIYFNSFS